VVEKTIYESIDGKRRVRIEQDGEYLALLWTRNGYQWQGGELDRDGLLQIHAAIESALPDAFAVAATPGSPL
jgi:hypothetical protein